MEENLRTRVDGVFRSSETLVNLGCGRASSLSPSIARLQQSLFIIFVSMEDSCLIGAFGSIRLSRRRIEINNPQI